MKKHPATAVFHNSMARLVFLGIMDCRRANYTIVIAHCCRCMRASHGRGPPNDPEHHGELVQRRGERVGRAEGAGGEK